MAAEYSQSTIAARLAFACDVGAAAAALQWFPGAGAGRADGGGARAAGAAAVSAPAAAVTTAGPDLPPALLPYACRARGATTAKPSARRTWTGCCSTTRTIR
jgi:hypothetical protein